MGGQQHQQQLNVPLRLHTCTQAAVAPSMYCNSGILVPCLTRVPSPCQHPPAGTPSPTTWMCRMYACTTGKLYSPISSFTKAMPLVLAAT